MKRHGVVLSFDTPHNMTEEDIEAMIQVWLDQMEGTAVAGRMESRVHEYEDDFGGPVWYIP